MRIYYRHIRFLLGALLFWGFAQAQENESGAGTPLFDMTEILDASSLKVEIMEDWHRVEGEVPTRQKFMSISVGELWPGQDYRIPVRMIVPVDSRAKGFHLTGGHGHRTMEKDAQLKPVEKELIAGGVGLVYTIVQNIATSPTQKVLGEQMHKRFIESLNPHYSIQYWAWPATMMRAITAAYAEEEYFEEGKVAVSGGSKNGASPSVAMIVDERITAQHARISPIYDSPLRLCDPSAWTELKKENTVYPETNAFAKRFQGGTFGPVYNAEALKAGHSWEAIRKLALQLADDLFISRNLEKLGQRGVDLLFEPGTHDCVAYDVPWGGEHFPQIPIYLKANSGHGKRKVIHPKAEPDEKNLSAFLLGHFFQDMEPMLEPPSVEYEIKEGKLQIQIQFKPDSHEEGGRIWWIYDRHLDGSAAYLHDLFPENQWQDMKYSRQKKAWTAEIALPENVSHIDFFSNHKKTLKRSSTIYPTYISSPYTRIQLK
ncbi:MAG: hypothetical protein AAF587_08380 [Bacteroidota bacterium]